MVYDHVNVYALGVHKVSFICQLVFDHMQLLSGLSPDTVLGSTRQGLGYYKQYTFPPFWCPQGSSYLSGDSKWKVVSEFTSEFSLPHPSS